MSLLHKSAMVAWSHLFIYGAPNPAMVCYCEYTSTVGGGVHGGLEPGLWTQTKSVRPAALQLRCGIFMKEEWACCFSNTLKTLKKYILLQPKTNTQKSMYFLKRGNQDCKLRGQEEKETKRKEEERRERKNGKTSRSTSLAKEIRGLAPILAFLASASHSDVQ